MMHVRYDALMLTLTAVNPRLFTTTQAFVLAGSFIFTTLCF